MAKLGLVVGGVVVAGLAYLPIYEKNVIDEEVQKVVTSLENNGFSVEMTPSSGYLSSFRTFTIKVVDGAKATNFVLDRSSDTLPEQNRYLVEKIKESLSSQKDQKKLKKAFDGTIFKGSLSHSNVGTPSIDSEINLIESPFMKSTNQKFKEFCKDGKFGVKINYKDDKNFNVDFKDFKLTENHDTIEINGLTLYGKKLGKNFFKLNQFSYDYKSSYRTEKFVLKNLDTAVSYQNKYNNKITTNLGSLSYSKDTKYKEQEIKVENIKLSSYVKELNTISVGFTTNIETFYLLGARKGVNGSFNKEVVDIQDFKFNFDVEKLSKKPFKKLVSIEEEVTKNPSALNPVEVEKVVMELFNDGLELSAKSSINSTNIANMFHLQFPLSVDAKFKLNKNSALRTNQIAKYVSAKVDISLDAKNTKTPSPMLSQSMFDQYLKKGKKVGANLVFTIEMEKNKLTLNGETL